MLTGIRIIRQRRRADRLAAQGEARAAFDAYAEVAQFWAEVDPILAAGNWQQAARQAALPEDRPAQVRACEAALRLLPSPEQWATPLTREAGVLTAGPGRRRPVLAWPVGGGRVDGPPGGRR